MYYRWWFSCTIDVQVSNLAVLFCSLMTDIFHMLRIRRESYLLLNSRRQKIGYMKTVKMKQKEFILLNLRNSRRCASFGCITIMVFSPPLFILKKVSLSMCVNGAWPFSKVTQLRTVSRRTQKEELWLTSLYTASTVTEKRPCPMIQSLITLIYQTSKKYIFLFCFSLHSVKAFWTFSN